MTPLESHLSGPRFVSHPVFIVTHSTSPHRRLLTGTRQPYWYFPLCSYFVCAPANKFTYKGVVIKSVNSWPRAKINKSLAAHTSSTTPLRNSVAISDLTGSRLTHKCAILQVEWPTRTHIIISQWEFFLNIGKSHQVVIFRSVVLWCNPPGNVPVVLLSCRLID